MKTHSVKNEEPAVGTAQVADNGLTACAGNHTTQHLLYHISLVLRISSGLAPNGNFPSVENGRGFRQRGRATGADSLIPEYRLAAAEFFTKSAINQRVVSL